MADQLHVEENAVEYSKVKSIKAEGHEDVFCITVPETGNFLVNEGIVVKNCLDAIRYALFTHLFGTDHQRLTPQDIEQMHKDALGGEWKLPRFFQDDNFGMY
ncbi:MAG: hypothetical protein ACLFUW_00330 [Bacteroidales bacterium]